MKLRNSAHKLGSIEMGEFNGVTYVDVNEAPSSPRKLVRSEDEKKSNRIEEEMCKCLMKMIEKREETAILKKRMRERGVGREDGEKVMCN